jgi:hypothetical protein
MIRGVPTFRKGASTESMWVEHAKLIAKLCIETGGNIAEERGRRRMMQHTAADERSLRGIPAIGARGAPSAIAGTDPLRSLLAKESRRGR